LLELWNIEKSLRNRPGFGDACCFDEQIVEPALFEQVLNTLHKVLPHGAAQAAVAHFHNLLLLGLHQLTIDADLPNLVDDHRKFVLMLLFENVIEQRGFAGT
jgi:hypothetical protein